MPSTIAALGFGFGAVIVALFALSLANRSAGFTRSHGPIFAAFAGGLVIAIALLQLIPEAFRMTEKAPWFILVGFGVGFIIHSFAHTKSHQNPPTKNIFAIAPVLAIALHSTLDGLVYAITFEVDFYLGLSTATGLLLHEFPEALVCFIFLQRAGFSDRLSTLFAFIASGVTTFVAAALSLTFTHELDPTLLGYMFALTAGLLLHVGATHLLQESNRAGFVKGGSAGLAGALIAGLMSLSHSDHTHNHEHGHEHDQEHSTIKK